MPDRNPVQDQPLAMSNRTLINSVHIQGFRSLADFQVDCLPQAAVFIGANGSGKSNLIRFFEMLSWMLRSRRLAEFVGRQGGAADQLFGGSKRTSLLKAEVSLQTPAGKHDYRFALTPVHPDRFIFVDEAFRFSDTRGTEASWQRVEHSIGQSEAGITETRRDINATTASVIVNLLRDCATYQFHDTSNSSYFKKRWDVEDNAQLRSHGGNLAAVLYRLEQEDNRRYELICRHIGRILPVFDRFALEESYGKVALRWKAKATDKTFGAHLTSDSSLRCFALMTLLNLPPEMLPSVLLLDGPELGLHPAAVHLIAHMIKQLAGDKQIMVATQSPLLVDIFDLEEILVLDLLDGRTHCRKLEPADYEAWLDDYVPGQLWQKNLLGGYP